LVWCPSRQPTQLPRPVQRSCIPVGYVSLWAPFRCRKFYADSVSLQRARVLHLLKPAAWCLQAHRRAPLFLTLHSLECWIGPRAISRIRLSSLTGRSHSTGKFHFPAFAKICSPVFQAESDCMARKPCIAIGLLPLAPVALTTGAMGFHPSHQIGPVDFRLMSACSGLHRHRFLIQDFRHTLRLWTTVQNGPFGSALPQSAAFRRKRLTQQSYRHSCIAGSRRWTYSDGNRVVKNLTLACALIKNSRGLLAGHRFIFALSIPVARDFWCRPSSPLAGTPTALLVRPAALDSKVFGRFSRLTITGGRGCCCQLLP